MFVKRMYKLNISYNGRKKEQTAGTYNNINKT